MPTALYIELYFQRPVCAGPDMSPALLGADIISDSPGLNWEMLTYHTNAPVTFFIFPMFLYQHLLGFPHFSARKLSVLYSLHLNTTLPHAMKRIETSIANNKKHYTIYQY